MYSDENKTIYFVNLALQMAVLCSVGGARGFVQTQQILWISQCTKCATKQPHIPHYCTAL